ECGLIPLDACLPLELYVRYTGRQRSHQIRAEKPRIDRRLRFLHDRPLRQVRPRSALDALESVAIFDPVRLVATAIRAYEAVRILGFDHVRHARALLIEHAVELELVAGELHGLSPVWLRVEALPHNGLCFRFVYH